MPDASSRVQQQSLAPQQKQAFTGLGISSDEDCGYDQWRNAELWSERILKHSHIPATWLGAFCLCFWWRSKKDCTFDEWLAAELWKAQSLKHRSRLSVSWTILGTTDCVNTENTRQFVQAHISFISIWILQWLLTTKVVLYILHRPVIQVSSPWNALVLRTSVSELRWRPDWLFIDLEICFTLLLFTTNPKHVHFRMGMEFGYIGITLVKLPHFG